MWARGRQLTQPSPGSAARARSDDATADLDCGAGQLHQPGPPRGAGGRDDQCHLGIGGPSGGQPLPALIGDEDGRRATRQQGSRWPAPPAGGPRAGGRPRRPRPQRRCRATPLRGAARRQPRPRAGAAARPAGRPSSSRASAPAPPVSLARRFPHVEYANRQHDEPRRRRSPASRVDLARRVHGHPLPDRRGHRQADHQPARGPQRLPPAPPSPSSPGPSRWPATIPRWASSS